MSLNDRLNRAEKKAAAAVPRSVPETVLTIEEEIIAPGVAVVRVPWVPTVGPITTKLEFLRIGNDESSRPLESN